jgi:metallo-beta-lactamase family protein
VNDDKETVMKISFHGADRNVTGSCHLIECAGRRILIDCGLYQGSRELVEENSEDFGFDPASIDFLLLTHAHLDHCGRIPLLSKRGFKGEIITTSASRELARLVLLDSAHLQEEEARYHARRRARHGHRSSPAPLYTVLDALNSSEHFGRTAEYSKPLELSPGIRATFYDAGHILGSASIYLELDEHGDHRTVLFSGDIGNAGRALLRDPSTPDHADVVVMETTYGDRLHKELQPTIQELYDAINATMERGGNVIIPTFALERAQELLYYLRKGMMQKSLPGSLQVFLDSPMAISATEIFERHPECYESDVAELFREGGDPFHLPGLHFTRETSESIAINRLRSGAVILAGSGMCTGGRVRHHLKQNLWRSESSVIFVGYASRGTLARRIIDGAKEVHIFGEEIKIRAKIHTISGFSAHADQAELLAWFKSMQTPERTILVHGDREAMEHFAGLLPETTSVEMPELGESRNL